MADLKIKGGTVLTMDGAVIQHGVVVIDNGLITSVGREANEKADRVIDATGCIVMPGLINAHTHSPMTLFRGMTDNLAYDEWTNKIRQAEARLTPSDVMAGAYLAALEMIRSGTTTFADMYIHMDEVAHVVEKAGLRAALGYGMIEGLNEDSETKLKNREKFSKKWNGAADGRITTMYAPHSTSSCSREFLMKVRELATKDSFRIHIHILETQDELHLMKKQYGMCSINLLNSMDFLGPDVLAAHCVWLSDEDINILKSMEVNVVHCPSSNMALGTGIAPVPRMIEKRINVALGTDGPASAWSLDMWKEMRTASYLHRLKDPCSMPSQTVLEMATVNGAKALGMNTGMLKPGYFADIILVDMKKSHLTSSNMRSALAIAASGCDVKTTIVNGKVLMEDHKVELDEEKIMEDAKTSMSKIAENSK
ncbi:MAG: amidohydrolase family protein [Candidatus Methanoperedens sp.]|nr:amidohydrolase family protein [Candidatus Methanoperedens sp.]